MSDIQPAAGARLGSRAASVVLVVALFAVLAVWIIRTLPHHVPQLPAPEVELTSAELDLAGSIPHYRDAIPVLTYHGITDTNPGPYTVSTRLFASHLQALREAGFTSVNLATLNDFILGKHVELPDKPIAITFDDGEANTWARADPILQKYGYSAIGFLITGSIAARDSASYYLNETQLRSLNDTGRWEFGGHTDRLHSYQAVGRDVSDTTLDHRVLRPDGTVESFEQWRQRVDTDLAASQRFFVDHFGRNATTFAYPFSAYGHGSNDPAIEQELPRLLAAHGYRTAFIGEQVEPRMVVLPGRNPMIAPRLGIRSTTTVTELLARIKDSVPTPLPSDAAPLSWSGEGGNCAPIRDAVPTAVRVTPTSSYAACRPEANTTQWRDYRFSTDIWGASRTTTAIVSVRASYIAAVGPGRLEVALGESSAQVRQVLGDRIQPLGRIQFPTRTGAAPMRHLEITVRGATTMITIDALPPLTAHIDQAIGAGGVGLSAASTPMRPVLFTAPTFHTD